MKQFVIFILFAVTCSAFPKVNIVNGTNAQEGEFKWAVSLRLDDKHRCGGTILNKMHVLTAAHCVCEDNIPSDPGNYSIQYGSVNISDTEERSIILQEIICAPFDYDKRIYDVAVVKLDQEIPDDGLWEEIKLSRDFNSSIDHDGVIVGWGAVWAGGRRSPILQKLNVTTYNDTVCGINYNNFHHVCLGVPYYGGSCYGDSGTALIVNGEQVGITSFITNQCGISTEEYPNVYSRVPSYYDWIIEKSQQ